jgi:hypothetical protein
VEKRHHTVFLVTVHNAMRRVVVTGLGAVTPLGVGEFVFSYLLNLTDVLWGASHF